MAPSDRKYLGASGGRVRFENDDRIIADRPQQFKVVVLQPRLPPARTQHYAYRMPPLPSTLALQHATPYSALPPPERVVIVPANPVFVFRPAPRYELREPRERRRRNTVDGFVEAPMPPPAARERRYREPDAVPADRNERSKRRDAEPTRTLAAPRQLTPATASRSRDHRREISESSATTINSRSNRAETVTPATSPARSERRKSPVRRIEAADDRPRLKERIVTYDEQGRRVERYVYL